MTDLATRFRLQQALSWTSAARTFAGKHPETGEKVAVKILALADHAHVERLQARFDATASILGGLSHAALPDLLEHGVSERNEAFLVTRWFPGAKLSELDLEPGDLLLVVLQITEALESLALHGLVHLGVAADNVLVMPDMQAQLTGWGSSLLNVDWQSGPGLSLSVTNLHTAPELRRSGGKADALWRADLYSLASMTAELLGAIVEQTGATTQVRFPGELSRQISGPEALRSTLEQCLAADPDQRPDAYSMLTKAIQRAVPRDRRQQIAATQPMPPLRVTPAPREASVARVGADTTRMPALPPLPPPDVEKRSAENQEAENKEAENKEAERKTTREGGSSPASGDTGVHAIRQQTGAFLLPRSSSADGGERLFEASELADFLKEESFSEVLPPPDVLDEAATERGSRSADVEENTTAEIKVPVEATPEEDDDSDVGLRGAETEFVPADELQQMVSAASRAAVATPAGSQSPAVEPESPEEEAVEPDDEAATKLVTADALRDMVAAAARSESDDEEVAREAATELVPPDELRARVAAARQESEPGDAQEANEDVGMANPASTVFASSAEVQEMLARAADRSGDSLPASDPTDSVSAASPSSESPRKKPARAGAPDVASHTDDPWSSLRSGPSSRRSIPRWALAAAAVLGLVMVATLVAGLLRRAPEPDAPAPAPVMAEPLITEPPEPQLDPEMEQALILLGDGDWDQARPILAALEERATAGELSEADLEALQSASETLTLGYGEQVARRLEEALEQLDVNGMRSALRGGANATEALARRPGGEELLDRARTLLRAVDSFRSALDRGEGTEALERSLELRSLEPALEERFRAVERSQSQIEDRVVGLVDSGSYGEARLELERAERISALPDSLAALKTRIVQAMREESAVGDLLARAEEFSRQNRPHLGLDVLQPSNIPATQRGRANELRTRLQRQLAQLDAEAPAIEFLEEEELKKDVPYDIRLRVSDDYDVSEVRVQVRTEAAPNARPVAVRALGGEEYVAQVPESLHDGGPIQFWAAAVDRSGHRGRLGSEAEPVEVKRRRWFQVFRRRGDG